jgi:hypothetical protein
MWRHTSSAYQVANCNESTLCINSPSLPDSWIDHHFFFQSSTETHCAETNLLFRGLKFLPREYIKLLSVCYCSSAVSLQRFDLQWENTVVVVMQSIISSTGSKAVPPAPSWLLACLQVSGPRNEGAIKKKYDSKFWRHRAQENWRAEFIRTKGRHTKCQANLSRLYNVVFKVTLAVLYCTLYRIPESKLSHTTLVNRPDARAFMASCFLTHVVDELHLIHSLGSRHSSYSGLWIMLFSLCFPIEIRH